MSIRREAHAVVPWALVTALATTLVALGTAEDGIRGWSDAVWETGIAVGTVGLRKKGYRGRLYRWHTCCRWSRAAAALSQTPISRA